VYLGSWNQNGKMIKLAVKISKSNKEDLLNERNIWSNPKIQHKNIVRMYACVYIPEEGETNPIIDCPCILELNWNVSNAYYMHSLFLHRYFATGFGILLPWIAE
jgi:hypothetical protein